MFMSSNKTDKAHTCKPHLPKGVFAQTCKRDVINTRTSINHANSCKAELRATFWMDTCL